MTEFDPSKAVRQGNAAQLSKIMELDPTTADLWTGRDLPAMLRHQLAASLEFDLGSFKLAGPAVRNRKHALAEAAAAGVRSFADLLFRPEPPFELLKLSKEFFKARTQVCHKSSPEWKVAYLFYLLSILAAGEHAPTLSTLPSADLFRAAGWALKQTWVDEKTRERILAARKRLPV
ncbi:MAG TPA: hypothetical protein VJA21_08440 [Verrucomicrobiae bacterium]